MAEESNLLAIPEAGGWNLESVLSICFHPSFAVIIGVCNDNYLYAL